MKIEFVIFTLYKTCDATIQCSLMTFLCHAIAVAHDFVNSGGLFHLTTHNISLGTKLFRETGHNPVMLQIYIMHCKNMKP